MTTPAKKIAQTDIEKRLNIWIDEVTNASRHTSFDPGKSWWPLQGNRSKLTGKLARAVGVEDQIGLTANQMQASELGRQWKRKVQDFLGDRVHLWTMWDNVFISVAGKNDPEEPTEDNVVTNPSSSTVRSLKAKITAEVPIAAIPAPSAMAQRAAAKAVGKLNRAEMQKYQKGIDAGRLNEKEYDAALGHIRSGAIMPSEVMLKTAYSVLKGAERDGIAELAIPRLVSPRNGAVVNTHLKVAMLPPGKVNETVKSSYERSLALLKSILEGMYPSTEAKYNALKRLANDYGFAVIDRLRTMTMPETIAFKRFCRLSGNQAGKTSRFLRHLGILDRLLPRRDGSEEGFEQAHNEFDSDMKIVSRMPCPVNRVNAFVRRQNSACDPDIIPILMGMEGKKRGAYQPSAKRKRRRINTVQNSSVQEAEEDGCLLAKDTKANRTYLIKEGWKDVYLMCACGVPPDSWKEDLTEDP